MRKITATQAKKKAWTSFSIYTRTRDCLSTTGDPERGKCITCPREYPFKQLQAGHFIGGRHGAVLFQEKGVHAQCYYCNMTLKGNTLEYRRQIIKKYGEGYDEVLEEESRKIVQYKVHDYLRIAEYYKQKTKELLDEYNLHR